MNATATDHRANLITLYARRNTIYVEHLADIDAEIAVAENALHRAERKPTPRCSCGAEVNAPDGGCCNEACDMYSGVPF